MRREGGGMIIRKEYSNYLLPSQGQLIFKAMLKKKIESISFCALSNERPTDGDCHGFPFVGPIVLSFFNAENVVFNYDSLLNSVVLRGIHDSTKEKDFLKKLYCEDNYIPKCLQAKKIVEESCYNNQTIERISVFKYDDELFVKITKYPQFHQLLIEVTLSNKQQFIITCGFQLKHKDQGMALIIDKYDDIAPYAIKNLCHLETYM